MRRVPPESLKLGFVVGLGLALAGRWVNSWAGAVAIVCGVCVMLYAKPPTTRRLTTGALTTLGL
jgi:hypothetical protein